MKQSTHIAYLDCFSGISGDMLLGALLHAGLKENFLRSELTKLKLNGLELTIGKKPSQSIEAVTLAVTSSINQELRTLPDIITLLDASELNTDIKERSIKVFTLLAEAEAQVHGTSIEKIHFHEVGAIDTIIDVVGAIIGLQALNIDRVICSPLPMGRGFVDCAHGRLPLPAPAVCTILHDVPTYGTAIDKELVTPTGAAIIKVIADSFGELPAMQIKRVGYGAGSHVLPNKQPNLLRLFIGETETEEPTESVEIIETNIDDWAPEGFQYLCERLLDNGALDVSAAHIQMKKGRPGYCIQVISPVGLSTVLSNILFSETTTIGVRVRTEKRYTLTRKTIIIETPYGEMQVKQVITPDGPVLYPEHDACVTAAKTHRVPLKEVYRTVTKLNTP